MSAIFKTDSGIFQDIQASNLLVTGDIKVGTEDQTINQYITQEINTAVGDVGGGGGFVADAFFTVLPSGIDIHAIEFTQTFTSIPSIATDLEISEGFMIPYAISGLSTTGYYAIFSEEIPSDNNYKIHTVFGGTADLTETTENLETISGTIDVISGDLVSLSGVVDNINVGSSIDVSEISGNLDTISGSVDTISGDLDALELTVDAATGDIEAISGAVQGILNAEASDDTAFNTLSGSVDTISGDLDALELTVDAATGDIFSISGVMDTATGDINEISGVVQTLSASSTTYGDTDVATYLDGNLDANIIPDTNSTYDIGSAEFKIRHLYLSDNSLYIGGTPGESGTQISAGDSGEIIFPSGLTAQSDVNINNIILNKINGVSATKQNDIIFWNGTNWTAGENIGSSDVAIVSGIADANAQNVDTLSGTLQGLLLDETEDDTSFSTVSGRVDALSGDLQSLTTVVDTATGDIDSISGVVQTLIGNENADDAAFNTLSGDVYGFYDRTADTISNVTGNFDALSFGSHNIPASSNSPGTIGQIAYSQDHIYMCVATNTWRRWILSDF